MTNFVDMKIIKGDIVSLELDEFVIPDRVGWVPYYNYFVIENETNTKVGRITFRLGDEDSMEFSGHIGYGIEEHYRGHHYSYLAVLLLMKLIKKHGYEEIILTCQDENIASKKTINKLEVLSFIQKEIPLKMRKDYSGNTRMNIYKTKVV